MSNPNNSDLHIFIAILFTSIYFHIVFPVF